VPGIFLNFRSADAGSYAAALLDEVLTRVFGADSVFRSSRSIPAGRQFDHELLASANSCAVMLSLIGPDWLGAAGGDGRRLLDRPEDWVRREIAIALRRDIPVIPVLLTGASLPERADLPPEIAGLADRQAVYLRHRHVGPDLAHLLGELARVAPELSAAGIFAPATALPRTYAPSMLLRPEYGVVPFSGRQAEVADITDWSSSGAATAARLITGPAGQGKTRLALHLCDLVRAEGWLAGVLPDDSEPAAVARLGGISAPLLLVVDYAEGQTERLLDLATTLTRRPPGAPTRLLLLARSAGEWLRGLHEHPDDRVAGLFLGAVEHCLMPLARGTADRHAEFARALRAIAGRLGRSYDDVDPPPDLGMDRFGRVLDIHAAALAGLLDRSSPGEGSDPRWDPVMRVLHHERRYWRRTVAVYELPDPSRARLDSVVAAATLFGASTSTQATDLLSGLPTFQGEKYETVARFARWMADLYPGPLTLNPLRPDRLGEDHVAAALAAEPKLASIPPPQVDDSRLGQAVTVLSRAAPRHPLAAQALADIAASTGRRFIDLAIGIATGLEDPRPLVSVLESSVADRAEPGLIASVQAKLPPRTTALAGLAVLASEHALAAHLRLPARDLTVTAHLLIDLSRHLYQQGRFDGALTAATEGAEFYRQLSAGDQDAFLPRFVSAMNFRSVCLGELGRSGEALEAATVAVGGFRHLAVAHPEAYDPELANSLSGLSNRYRAVGHRKEAVAAATEAVQVFLRLWDGGQENTVMPDLARALHNLAVHLSAAGQQDQALEVLTDAIDLRRRLASHNPDAFLPDLASSLNNRANLLDDLDRQAEATSAMAETVEIYRQLAEHRPEVFRPDLAMALSNYSINAAATFPADALAANWESVALYRSLAEQRPDIYHADLAMALNNLSGRLAQAGKPEDALTAVRESVSIRRELRPQDDREILHGLAASLNNLGIRLRALGRCQEAVAAAREAMAAFQQLASQEPAYRVRLAEAINGLAIAEAELGNMAASAEAASKAVTLLRALHEAQPAAYRRRLASALTNYGRAVWGSDTGLARSLLHEARGLCHQAADTELIQLIDDVLADSSGSQ
jgi:tetratricopeptide (TPR) repeat protein